MNKPITLEEMTAYMDATWKKCQSEAWGEPVATVTSETGAEISMSWWHEPALPVGTKLYTAPPQRKPLSDEQRDAIAKQAAENDWHDYEIIDAVEAAHGIKE